MPSPSSPRGANSGPAPAFALRLPEEEWELRGQETDGPIFPGAADPAGVRGVRPGETLSRETPCLCPGLVTRSQLRGFQAADLPLPLLTGGSFSAKIMPVLPVLVKVQREEVWVVVGGGSRSSSGVRRLCLPRAHDPCALRPCVLRGAAENR